MAKPYYKLKIGDTKPSTTADMRFRGGGRIRIEISDSWPDAPKVLAGLCDITWTEMCRRVLTFWEAAGAGVYLTEPADRPLREEVADG